MRRGVSGGRVPTLAETRYAAFGMTDNRLLSALVLVVVHGALAQSDPGSWKSILRDAAGNPAAVAVGEMHAAGRSLLSALVLVVVHGALAQSDPGSWKSILRDAAGNPAAVAVVEMHGAGSALRCRTDGNGAFELREIAAGVGKEEDSPRARALSNGGR